MRTGWVHAWRFAVALLLSFSAQATPTSMLVEADLRSDKLPTASVLRRLPAGTQAELVSIEGGWALIAVAGRSGWVRASALDLQAGRSQATQVATGRETAAPGIGTLAVRSLPVRGNRHALIIGISRYADPTVPSLPGAKIDGESATQMAIAMQVPLSNIHRLQDEQATADGIRAALRELEEKVADGDRVFIHFSGHGTRYFDAASGGCVEALLAHEGGRTGVISNREVADLLAPLSRKADKMFVMYDACYSGGVGGLDAAARTRGIVLAGDEGRLRPKFVPPADECARPANAKTRGLLGEAVSRGALPQDIVHVSSSRDDEISFDDELKGGLATQFMRDCMLRDAVDLDGSGAISIEEMRVCAQRKIDKRMENDPFFKAHNLVITGNSSFVPAWFAADQLALAATATAPLTGAQALRQIYDQRDAKRRVDVSLSSAKLKVGRDQVELAVQSDRKGYVYVALAGSDNEAVYVVFPNELDTDNRIDAGRTVKLPRPNWQLRAQGPAGVDNLIVIVADSPRDVAALGASRAGPFMKSPNDARGRAAIGALLTSSRDSAQEACTARKIGDSACSDAFGAAIINVEELP